VLEKEYHDFRYIPSPENGFVSVKVLV